MSLNETNLVAGERAKDIRHNKTLLSGRVDEGERGNSLGILAMIVCKYQYRYLT